MDQPASPPVETVPIDRLYCSPTNPRRNDVAVPHVAASLRRFGWQQPIVARRSGEVIAGNTRLKAAQQLGMTEVPVWWFDGSDIDAAAFAIADNRSHEFAEWDDPALVRLLEELRAEDSLDGVGYDEGEIDRLIAQLDAESADLGEDRVEALPEHSASRPGDLWLLGRHRLLCGSSTSHNDVHRLLDGSAPFLMVTDPPYGVAYDPAWRNQAGLCDTKRTGAVANDDRVDWSAAYALFPGTVAYVWHAGRFAAEVATHLHGCGMEIRAQIVWRKPRFAISRGHYHWQHEPCWYAVRDGESSKWCGDRSQSTVWDIEPCTAADDEATEHGTQKPAECMGRPIRNHGTREDAVYDPFVGSGTTIVAAERLKRRCFAMELDPRYVDVAVRRWQTASGEAATLDGDGRTFDEIAAERAEGDTHEEP
ncbi:MAG: DNA modification methylase [Planctomycetes bacterium]|nr:DNA modification methylase [Planctomycetota bacterium]